MCLHLLSMYGVIAFFAGLKMLPLYISDLCVHLSLQGQPARRSGMALCVGPQPKPTTASPSPAPNTSMTSTTKVTTLLVLTPPSEQSCSHHAHTWGTCTLRGTRLTGSSPLQCASCSQTAPIVTAGTMLIRVIPSPPTITEVNGVNGESVCSHQL